MKKAAMLFALAGTILCSIPSCKKEEPVRPPISETFSVQLKANETYTFTLPKNKRNDVYDITTQASHYSISTVGQDASGNRIYQYTPAPDYTGTDQVVLANPEEGKEHPEHPGKRKPHLLPPPHPHHGDCDGPEDHYIVTINFVIECASTTTEK